MKKYKTVKKLCYEFLFLFGISYIQIQFLESEFLQWTSWWVLFLFIFQISSMSKPLELLTYTLTCVLVCLHYKSTILKSVCSFIEYLWLMSRHFITGSDEKDTISTFHLYPYRWWNLERSRKLIFAKNMPLHRPVSFCILLLIYIRLEFIWIFKKWNLCCIFCNRKSFKST